jgi:transcriptional regulator with PAS, ATPase and Fis domain
MAEGVPGSDSSLTPAPSPDPAKVEFRWQALFQRTSEPIFLLNRHRRILFVNAAWERMTRLSAVEARGLVCVRRSPQPDDPWDLVIRALCCPPPEVQKGQAAHVRRLVPGAPPEARWWSIDFLPLAAESGLLGVLGKLSVARVPASSAASPLPEKLMALRTALFHRHALDALSGQSNALRLLQDQVRLASQIEAPVLLCGEAGSGKSWVARTIHAQSARNEQPYIEVDCRRLPPEIAAELCMRNGSLTICVSEPQLLPRENQQHLHQFIRQAQDGAGPRFLAACAIDAKRLTAINLLHHDLRTVLSALIICVPPLRECMEDLSLLVERLLPRANASQGTAITGLTSEASDVLSRYPWPGNLRELYGVLQTACGRAPGSRIDAGDLPAHVKLAVRLAETADAPKERRLPLKDVLEQTERRLIVAALKQAKGNRSRAAEILSIWRGLLARRMKALGITEW